MSRVLGILVGAAAIAVIAFVGHYFWRDYERSVAVAEAARRADCEPIERGFAAVRDGKPLPGSPPYDVLGRMVIACRGLPADTRLSDL